MRDRRVAVRKSLLQTLDFKHLLMPTSSSASLRAEAPEFKPSEFCVPKQVDTVLDWLVSDSAQALSPESSIPMVEGIEDTLCVPRRRNLREPCYAEALPPPASVQAEDCSVVHEYSLDGKTKMHSCMGRGRGQAILGSLVKGKGMTCSGNRDVVTCETSES